MSRKIKQDNYGNAVLFPIALYIVSLGEIEHRHSFFDSFPDNLRGIYNRQYQAIL